MDHAHIIAQAYMYSFLCTFMDYMYHAIFTHCVSASVLPYICASGWWWAVVLCCAQDGEQVGRVHGSMPQSLYEPAPPPAERNGSA